MIPEYQPVPIAAVVHETADACSLVLSVPPEAFRYRPGQFLTVRVPSGTGSGIARCYSLSSSPHTDDQLKITVKRMAGGYVSNWICDHVTAGTVLDMLPPAGGFTPASFDRDLLLFAGGSGITPVMSILKSALAVGHGRIVLVYANRDDRCVIFDAELRDLAARHADRLTVTHWLDCAQGPPTVPALRALIAPAAGSDVFVCGPDPYMAVVERALAESGVPPERVHVERFVLPADDAVESEAATVEVHLDGQTHRFPWPPGTRLLDLLIDRGLNPPFSCRQGNCGACACRILDGEVKLLNNEILEDEDFAEGYILACQAVPLTEEVRVTY
jgi:3-ketosteroid 9alpha-monooxygenase subunit B